MTLSLLLVAIACLLGGAAAAELAGRRRRLALLGGTAGAVLGGVLGAGISLRALVVGETASRRLTWSVPVGALHVGVDPLSSFFLLCLFTVATLSALYGAAYLARREDGHGVATAAAAFDVLVAAMAVVVLARDGVLFLFAWELMAIASFLLVAFEDDREEVARASYVYLAASHAGTAFLFLLFALLAARAGRFDFTAFAALALPPRFADACFLLALVGFGTKVGLWPLHFWLPQAHPAAPSHVSALMSGAMIELGLYGLLRTLSFLGAPTAWWGWSLLAVGGASALLGVLGALGARDLKRLLAYSSVENMGVIAIAVGLGITAAAEHHAGLAALAFAGALFHVWNHGLFKTVLFQGAGAVLHATHSRDLESFGGLARRMPRVALPFLAAALSASSLPPFNGFASEWVIYVAAFHGALLGHGVAGVSLSVIPLLALVGALASAAFVRAFGISFLGEPRSDAARGAHDAPWPLAAPPWIGAALCAVCGVAPQLFYPLAATAALAVVPSARETPEAIGLGELGTAALVLIVIGAGAALVRSRLLTGREVRAGVTWDCGYALPTARMQYTASSFAEPVLEPFTPILRSRITAVRPQGYFPAEARYDEQVEEGGAGAVSALAERIGVALSRVTVLQLGRIQIYLLYILITLIVVLAWWMPR